jgi:hypothetical protein
MPDFVISSEAKNLSSCLFAFDFEGLKMDASLRSAWHCDSISASLEQFNFEKV